MPDELSVRQWQEKFRAGAFSDPDAMDEAGWFNWECSSGSLPTRLKRLARIVMGITDPFILDNYYILFRNISSRFNRTYDEVGFVSFDVDDFRRYFSVSRNNPYHRKRWTLSTPRYSFISPEYDCINVQGMIQYINRIGPELEQGGKSSLAAECRVAEIYAYRRCGRHDEIPVYRDGEHLYSYISAQDRRKHFMIATGRPKDMPPGFRMDHAEKIQGLYVYCPEDAGKSLTVTEKAAGKSQKRKEPER